jgi:glucose-6-phosphate 1-dehydrogenase
MEPEPCTLVIFGASGDLTARKLIPALVEMASDGHLPAASCVLGVARRPKADDEWRQELAASVRERCPGIDEAVWRDVASRIHYEAADATTSEGMERVAGRIAKLDGEYKAHGNVLFFLSVGSALYEPIVAQIEAASLVTEGKRWCSIDPATRSWQRIIVEKPFGCDVKSAAALNRALGRVFEEESIYRIDHYLAKEAVQSMLAVRFANILWEPIWNHQYIDHVQISALESVGVGSRGAFYDSTGCIRDMIQSHLLQVLAFIAMEPPTNYTPEHVRSEKIKVVDAILPTPADAVATHCALGQYEGYGEIDGVAPGSTTETYAALKLHVENWRWAQTPFYLRSGKCLALKRTEVVVQFKPPAANLFRTLPAFKHEPNLVPNRLVLSIAPNDALSMRIETKRPGQGIVLDSVELQAAVGSESAKPEAEAYGPLLIDAMRGDQTLFKHRLEVESAWDALMPFLADDLGDVRSGIASTYADGSWGPASADALMARDGRAWKNGDPTVVSSPA